MNCKIINTDDRFAKVHMTTPLEGVAERLHAEYFRDTDILPALPPYSLNTENPPQVLRLFAKDSGALPVIRPIGKGTTVKQAMDYRAAVHHYTRNALQALLYANLLDEEYKNRCIATTIRLLQELDSKYN